MPGRYDMPLAFGAREEKFILKFLVASATYLYHDYGFLDASTGIRRLMPQRHCILAAAMPRSKAQKRAATPLREKCHTCHYYQASSFGATPHAEAGSSEVPT